MTTLERTRFSVLYYMIDILSTITPTILWTNIQKTQYVYYFRKSQKGSSFLLSPFLIKLNVNQIKYTAKQTKLTKRVRMWMLLLLLSLFSHARLCVTPRWQPARLPHPWDSPGRNTGIGCHFLLQCECYLPAINETFDLRCPIW